MMKDGGKLDFTSARVLTVLLLLVWACERPGEEIGIPTGPTPTVEYLVGKGWEAYEATDYSEAKSQFTTAILRDVFYDEAYLGLGWTLNRLSDYNNAIARFDLLLTLVTASDNELRLLSYAGKALSYAGMNSDSLSCIQARLYLDIAAPGYVFEHDSQVITANVQKLLLNGYWNYQDFYSVQNTIIDYFEPSWFDNLVISDNNLKDTTGVDAFIAVEIEVDTSVVPYDTSIASAKIALADDFNLLEVAAIKDSLAQVYPVRKFNHGGNVIHIDVDAMGDVSMLLDDLTQSVNVDFVYAEDYGKYLNTLMAKVQSLY